MFVVVVCGDIHLANPAWRIVAVHFGKRANLQPPVPRDSVHPGQVGGHAEFSGQRIAEAVEKSEKIMRPDELLEGSDQRRHQQTGNAPVHFAGYPAVVSLAKHIVQVLIDDGVTQSRQQFAAVSDDVAIMQGDNVRAASRKHIAVGKPYRTPLAALADIESVAGKRLIYFAYPLAVIVDDLDFSRYRRHELPHL